MNIRKLQIIFYIIIGLLTPLTLNSQNDKYINQCADYLNIPFINNGQPFRAFLTENEVAEFKTTFLSGSTYRIVACGGQENQILFSLYDKNRNLLFSNEDHEKSAYWDFKIEGSLDCIIEARLNPDISTSGLALVMIGFKNILD